jgi:MoxR-like ATPase
VTGLLAGSHVLVEGVPGVAKTLIVKTMAAALDLRYSRIQFTPDLMPSDVVGQSVFDARDATFRFREGPVFANVVLADEINRTPPKTQAALLEAMEENQVTVEGAARALPRPFFVVATQNPIEFEGTYPLPEAQLDRFVFKLTMDYPGRGEEAEIVSRHHRGLDPHDLATAGVRAVITADHVAAAREEVAAIAVDDKVIGYIVDVVRATRGHPHVRVGVSPRGATAVLHAAKAWAWLSGRAFVTPDEVKAVARPALRHRFQLRPDAALDGVTADAIVDNVLASVATPR